MIRYCWAFIIAEATVLVMVVVWPDLAAWIRIISSAERPRPL
jgi:hypothetical protein